MPILQTAAAIIVAWAVSGCAKKEPAVESPPIRAEKPVAEEPIPSDEAGTPVTKSALAGAQAEPKNVSEKSPPTTSPASGADSDARRSVQPVGQGKKGETLPVSDEATTAVIEKVRSILGQAAVQARAGKPAEAIKTAGPAASLLAAHGDDPGYDGVRAEFDAAVRSWAEKLPASARPSGIGARNKTIVEQ